MSNQSFIKNKHFEVHKNLSVHIAEASFGRLRGEIIRVGYVKG